MAFQVGQFRVANNLEGALIAAKAMMDEGNGGQVQIKDTQTGEVYDEAAILELIEQQKNA